MAKKVFAGKREFDSVEALIATDTPELDAGLPTDSGQTYWWYSLTVSFEKNTSAGMVEVHAQRVLLGYPAFYKTYEFEDGESALHWAWRKHLEWLDWQAAHPGPDDWQEFVKQDHDQTAIAIWCNRHPYHITSRQQLAATLGWDADDQRTANVWNFLGQGKGVTLLAKLPSEDAPVKVNLLPRDSFTMTLEKPTVTDTLDLTNLSFYSS